MRRVCLGLALTGTGCGPQVLSIEELVDAQRVRDDVPGVAVVVRRGGDVLLEVAVGEEALGGPAMTVHSPVHAGSLTKSFTAVLVLQEVERGTWTLDDPISDWVDGVPGGEERTLRGLLSHTSGLGDFLDSERYLSDSNRVWTHEEALAEAYAVEEEVPENVRWLYSNAGYVLLGLALEEATGQTWETLVAGRITGPLGLVNTGRSSKVVPIPGYDRAAAGDEPVTPHLNPENTWAGGALVSTAWDLALFAEAMHDEVLLPADLAELQREQVVLWTGRVERYGLGVGVDSIRDRREQVLGYNIGHQGRSPGHAASMSWRTYEGVVLAVTLNNRPSGGRRFEKLVLGPVEASLQRERLPAGEIPVFTETGWW